MERVKVGLTYRVSGSMGGGFRVSRAVGGALVLGTVPLFVVLPASGTAGGLGTASLYFWFFPESMSGSVGVGSAVKRLAAARASESGGNNVGGS